MGFGSNSGGKTLFFTFKNLKKDAPKAYIEVYDHGKGEIIDECDFVKGKLVDVIFGEGEYEGVPYPTVEFVLKDNEDGTRYKVKSGFGKITGVTRAILNRLITATSFDEITISYFGKENDFKNASVKEGNDKLEYFMSRDEMLPYIHEMKNAKDEVVQRDYSKADEHLMAQFKDIVAPQLEGDTKPKAEEKKASDLPETPAEQTGSEAIDAIAENNTASPKIDITPEDGDDLPF